MATKVNSSTQVEAPASSNYAIIGGLQYCWGVHTIANAGTDITFPRAFSAVPAVVCTTRDTNEQSAWVHSRTATYVRLRQKYAANPLWVNWIAIGPA